MNKLFLLVGAGSAALLMATACVVESSDDGSGGSGGDAGTGGSGGAETVGTGGNGTGGNGTGGNGTGGNGTGGNGDECLSCADWATTEDDGDLCEGTSTDLWDEFQECACTTCETECGAGCADWSEDNDDCLSCLEGSATGDCKTEFDACANDI